MYSRIKGKLLERSQSDPDRQTGEVTDVLNLYNDESVIKIYGFPCNATLKEENGAVELDARFYCKRDNSGFYGRYVAPRKQGTAVDAK